MSRQYISHSSRSAFFQIFRSRLFIPLLPNFVYIIVLKMTYADQRRTEWLSFNNCLWFSSYISPYKPNIIAIKAKILILWFNDVSKFRLFKFFVKAVSVIKTNLFLTKDKYLSDQRAEDLEEFSGVV